MSKVGIICDIQRNRYCILTDQGDFLMRPGKPPAGKKLGDRISISATSKTWMRGAAIAAALALVVISTLQFIPGAPEQAKFHMALDINPSLEFVYDEHYQVLEWNAFNEEGRVVLKDLERPDDLYAALEAVFARCLELELARDEHNIFVTTEAGAPIDDDRLLGAFEGHGTSVQLHLVNLPESEYQAGGSPLRGYLNRKTGANLDEAAPVAAVALNSLGSELVTTLDVMPWHKNPVIQAFIEKYLVSGSLVEEMLAAGLSSDEIANLLELAQTDKISPSDVFKQLRDSGLAPGQFLKEKKSPGNAKAPDLVAPDWLLDLLVQEFGHTAGQLSSYLNKGIDSGDLQDLLILEMLGVGELRALVRTQESTSVEEMLGEAGIDRGQFDRHRQRVQELVQVAATWVEDSAVGSLSAEYKLTKAEVLYILARGYTGKQAEEIIQTMPKGNVSVKEHLDNLENNSNGGNNSNEQPGQGNQPGSNPDQRPGNSPGSPPGQSKDKGN